MRLDQYYGYDANGGRVTGSTVAQCRDRGAVGVVYREHETWENGAWVVIVERCL